MSFEEKIIQNIEKSLKRARGENSLQFSEQDIVETTSKIVTKLVPKNQVLSFDEAVDLVSNKSKVDGNLVARGLSRAISKQDFSVVNNAHGVWVRRNAI